MPSVTPKKVKPLRAQPSQLIDTDVVSCSSDNSRDFSQSFMYNLHQIFFLLEKHLESTLLRDKNISFSQFMILVGFDCRKEKSISQKMIAEKLYLTEATVSRHINTLVKLGHLVQTIDKENRRKKTIDITLSGKKAFEKARNSIDKELNVIFASILVSDRASILKNFTNVRKQLLTKK